MGGVFERGWEAQRQDTEGHTHHAADDTGGGRCAGSDAGSGGPVSVHPQAHRGRVQAKGEVMHYLCCPRGRWLCLLDNLLHDLHITIRPLCDWHDRRITQ